jgi:hypothetical protein
MTKTGALFGVDLFRLWQCATTNLPELAARVEAANQTIAGASNDSSSFSSQGVIPGSPGIVGSVTDPVYPAWSQLRDAFESVLAKSAKNVYDSADALITIANAYAAQDDAARIEMQARANDFKSNHTAGQDYHETGDRPAVTDPLATADQTTTTGP